MLIATEDVVGEAIALKLLNDYRPDLNITTITSIQKSGKGYLKGRISELNRSAANIEVLVIADIDNPALCPVTEAVSWVSIRNQNLVFRFAKCEGEAWLLADLHGLAGYFKINSSRLDPDAESITSPKEEIVRLARLSPLKKVKEDLIPNHESTAVVGRAYNSRIIDFINNFWSPERARVNSETLNNTINRLHKQRISAF